MAIHVMEGQQRYDSFVQAFRDANPYLKKQVQFLEAQKTWNNLKTEPEKIYGQDDVEEDVMEEEENGSAYHAMEICSDVESESNCIMPVIENLAEFLNSPFVEK
jgi:hypothetical protein